MLTFLVLTVNCLIFIPPEHLSAWHSSLFPQNTLAIFWPGHQASWGWLEMHSQVSVPRAFPAVNNMNQASSLKLNFALGSSPITEEFSFQAVQNSSFLIHKDLHEFFAFVFIPANILSFIYSEPKGDVWPKVWIIMLLLHLNHRFQRLL